MLKIVKRNGNIEPFDGQKIIDAVLAAFYSTDKEITDYSAEKAENIAAYIEAVAEETGRPLDIEEIQDMVEHGLQSTKRKDVAKNYILYRAEQERKRLKKNPLIKEVGEKIMALNIQNQNANVDEASFGGRKGEAANTILKQYALDYIMSEKARYNHINNIIYTHDLDSYAIGMHNCLSIPFDDLLAKGFNTRQTDIRPANCVATALQLFAVIFQLQSLQQFGGVSATHIDWTMVPYVRKSFWKHFRDGLKYIEQLEFKWDKDFNHIIPEEYSIELPKDGMDIGTKGNVKCGILNEHMKAYKYAIDMTERELKQAVEAMYHNLNTLQSRSGNQLPFTSINYGTCTLPEGRMVTKALLEGSLKGVGKLGRTPIFPCGIFQCMKGVNRKEGDPNYDLFQLALKSTSKRLYPNYANVDWSGNAGYDVNDPRTYFSTMGKRKL